MAAEAGQGFCDDASAHLYKQMRWHAGDYCRGGSVESDDTPRPSAFVSLGATKTTETLSSRRTDETVTRFHCGIPLFIPE